jgi:proline iminopeptidase
MMTMTGIEPSATGMLDVGDGNEVYWETWGNPDGKPAVFVHGGPGSGCTPRSGRSFDPARYRCVRFDQRGCGRSAPHASDPATDMAANTTHHLIADLERLREHLGIEKWLLYGGSWGSTLILAYAQRFAHRVSEIVIASITTSRRSEQDWLYRGAARFFPDSWQRFHEAAQDDDLGAGYARLMADPDFAVRDRAARAWLAWEDAVVSLEPGGIADYYSSRPTEAGHAFVRICAHYYANHAWLADGELLRNAHLLAGIPGVLVHGRLDLSCPLDTAWELARAWPGAELTVLDSAGHQGTDARREVIVDALDRFASTG